MSLPTFLTGHARPLQSPIFPGSLWAPCYVPVAGLFVPELILYRFLFVRNK